MTSEPKTTIWRNTPGGTVLVETQNGIPFPTPTFGQVVLNHKFGKTICSGTTISGSDVTEVKLTIS